MAATCRVFVYMTDGTDREAGVFQSNEYPDVLAQAACSFFQYPLVEGIEHKYRVEVLHRNGSVDFSRDCDPKDYKEQIIAALNRYMLERDIDIPAIADSDLFALMEA